MAKTGKAQAFNDVIEDLIARAGQVQDSLN